MGWRRSALALALGLLFALGCRHGAPRMVEVQPGDPSALRIVVAPMNLAVPLGPDLQDQLGLVYASDLRGGPVCLLRAGGRMLATPQIPTTGRCIEELLTAGVADEDAIVAAILADLSGADPAVLAVHAEVEGGPFAALFEKLLARVLASGVRIVTLESVARGLELSTLPRRELAHVEIPGRSGRVSSSAATGVPA